MPRRLLAVSTVIAGVVLCTVAPPAQAAIGCRPDSVSNAYFELSVKRALLSCDVVEVGMRGTAALPTGGAAFSVWGPDNFTGMVRVGPGEYSVAWKGDHAAGARWCASFVGDYAELCLTT
ncbi:hypothetical protein [Kutzneria sp. CA-103260]|uniref:hypothetical protein n=1 Tax=Kutzneria sp. CA-103260 TaxID=2802641 RepID=UPI001BA4D54F|nr:hypothetical protein [Kutzneria sp. CA-103260]QUQ71567.1 hypothetical protein JJ691_93540 [Kutzneria sp. CA-103260]